MAAGALAIVVLARTHALGLNGALAAGGASSSAGGSSPRRALARPCAADAGRAVAALAQPELGLRRGRGRAAPALAAGGTASPAATSRPCCTGGKFFAIQARQILRSSANAEPPSSTVYDRGPKTTLLRRVQLRPADDVVDVLDLVGWQVGPDRLRRRSAAAWAGRRAPGRGPSSRAAITSSCWRRARPKSLSPLRLRAKIRAVFPLSLLEPAGRPQPCVFEFTQ